MFKVNDDEVQYTKLVKEDNLKLFKTLRCTSITGIILGILICSIAFIQTTHIAAFVTGGLLLLSSIILFIITIFGRRNGTLGQKKIR